MELITLATYPTERLAQSSVEYRTNPFSWLEWRTVPGTRRKVVAVVIPTR